MSKGAGTTKTVSSTSVPSAQLPYVEELLSRAKGQLTAGPTTFYPGETVAPFSATERMGQEQVLGAAPKAAWAAENIMAPALYDASKAYDVNQNPYLASAAAGAVCPVFQELTENVLPQIRHGGVLSGAYGGTRQQIGEGLATERAVRSAQEATTGMYSSAYQQGLNTALQAASMTPNLQEALAYPGALVSGVGEQERAVEQAKINEAIARHEYGQTAPRTALAEYAKLIGAPMGGEATSEVQAAGTGGAQQISAAALGLLPYIFKLLGWG